MTTETMPRLQRDQLKEIFERISRFHLPVPETRIFYVLSNMLDLIRQDL